MAKDEEMCTEETPFDEQLNLLRDQLLSWQTKFQEATSEISEREVQIEALSGFIDEFDAIVEVYENAYPDLKAKQSDYEKCCENQKSCLENILGDKCSKAVCDKVKEIKDEIKCRKTDIESDEESLTEAKTTRDSAELALTEVKDRFEELKTPVKSIEARFKELDLLKTEIDKNQDEHSNTIAYYLLACELKFCSQTKDIPQVLSVEEFITELRCAWKRYVDADSYFNEKDALVKGLEKTLETKKVQLEADKANLEVKIRRKLTELANSEICSKNETDNCKET